METARHRAVGLRLAELAPPSKRCSAIPGSPLALATSRRFVLNGGLLMRISDFIARTITQRRALVWCGVAALTLVCIAILLTSLRLDSEIFNVLPGKFPSVQGLKIYDHDFEQTRELTFALVC